MFPVFITLSPLHSRPQTLRPNNFDIKDKRIDREAKKNQTACKSCNFVSENNFPTMMGDMGIEFSRHVSVNIRSGI